MGGSITYLYIKSSPSAIEIAIFQLLFVSGKFGKFTGFCKFSNFHGIFMPVWGIIKGY